MREKAMFSSGGMERGNFDKFHEMGNENLETGREMGMKMKWDCLDEKPNHREMKMEKKKGGKNENFVGEMSPQETEAAEEKSEEEVEEKGENGVIVGCEENNCNFGGYNKEMAPVDDVCPICFDRFTVIDKFTVICRSNCGHWFCASCILAFWMYRSSIQPCKCPLCRSKMVSLKPETSQLIQPTADTLEILRKVQQYNGLYADGLHGLCLKVLALPLFMGRMCRILIDPDGLRCIYYVMRLLGLLLALLYERGEFEFIPTGGLGIQRTFGMAASLLVLALFVVGVGYRWVLRGQARRRMAELDR